MSFLKKNEESNKSAPGYMRRWGLEHYKAVAAVGCVLILVVGYFLVISPKLNNIKKSINPDLAYEKERQQKMEEELDYLIMLEEQRNKVSEEQLDKINMVLPNRPMLPMLIANLEGLAVANSLVVESFNISYIKPNPKDVVDTSLMPAGVNGVEVTVIMKPQSYENIKNYVGDVEKNMRIMDISSMQYNPAGDKYNLTVRAYYQR